VRATSARPRSGLFVRTIVPNSQTRARQQWGRQIAADVAWLLEQIDTDPAEGWLARLPTVQALREVWGQECVADGATREPYEQCWTMRSVGLSALVRGPSGADRCT
jgi:hypothetical protein